MDIRLPKCLKCGGEGHNHGKDCELRWDAFAVPACPTCETKEMCMRCQCVRVRIGCVYKLVSSQTQDTYLGQTIHPWTREKEHRCHPCRASWAVARFDDCQLIVIRIVCEKMSYADFETALLDAESQEIASCGGRCLVNKLFPKSKNLASQLRWQKGRLGLAEVKKAWANLLNCKRVTKCHQNPLRREDYQEYQIWYNGTREGRQKADCVAMTD